MSGSGSVLFIPPVFLGARALGFSLPVLSGGGPKFRVAHDPDLSGLTLWRSNRLPRDAPACHLAGTATLSFLSGLTAEGETPHYSFDLRAGKVTRQI